MKLNTQAFPYPVLTSDSGVAADYDDCAFQSTLMFEPEVQEDGSFSVNYSFQISNEEISDLIDEDRASFAIDLNCPDTLKREMYFLKHEGILKINAFDLYGKVDFTPIIVVRKPVKNFTSVDLNPEFNGAVFDLQIGDVIAFDDTLTKYFEFNNQSFDSLVKTRMSDKLDPFSYIVEPTPNFIYITMGKDMHKLYKEMSATKYKSTLGMSIFKDVLFLAIQDLITTEDADSQQWARSFRSRINELGFEIPEELEFNQVNLLAQKFVQEIGAQKLFKELKLGTT